MKNRMIYYFSGSGNSLYVARQTASETGSGILPVKIVSDERDPCLEYDVIGFVFPVYDFNAPEYVLKCIENMKINRDAYIFCIATYGLSAGRGIERFAEKLADKDLKLSAGFSIAMPHNGICSAKVPLKIIQKRLGDAPERISVIADKVKRKEIFLENRQSVAYGMLRSGLFRMLPGLLKFVAVIVTRGIDTLAYKVDGNCIGCGRCEIICPQNNIKMINGRPEWGDNCAGCFGCLHWCPEKAISLGGRNMNIMHYHHPEISAGDMSI